MQRGGGRFLARGDPIKVGYIGFEAQWKSTHRWNSQIKGYGGSWGALRKIVTYIIYFLPQKYHTSYSAPFHIYLGSFATFLDFTLFNILPDCVTFSDVFHQTLFAWLLHNSFNLSGFILGWSALHFTDVLPFILLLQWYLCFLIPPCLPKTIESSSFDFIATPVILTHISCILHWLLSPIKTLLYYFYGPFAWLNVIFCTFSGPLSLY